MVYAGIDTAAVLAVAAIYALGVVIPGPNFVAVTHTAVSASRIEALALVAGIVLVNLFWASCALLGVGAVFAWFPLVGLGVKAAGALYLIWFGLRLWRSPAAPDAAEAMTSTASPDGGAWAGASVRRLRRAFGSGRLVNLTNPKTIVFYAATFSSAAPAEVSVATFLAMLATVGTLAALWYGLVALLLSAPAIAAGFRKRRRGFDRVCGSALLALGLRQLHALRGG